PPYIRQRFFPFTISELTQLPFAFRAPQRWAFRKGNGSWLFRSVELLTSFVLHLPPGKKLHEHVTAGHLFMGSRRSSLLTKFFNQPCRPQRPYIRPQLFSQVPRVCGKHRISDDPLDCCTQFFRPNLLFSVNVFHEYDLRRSGGLHSARVAQ